MRNRKSFAQLERLVKLKGYLEVQSALHIGKGRALDPGAASDMPVIKDIKGFPFIPGSSLKGLLRSFVESVVRGLRKHDKISCCNPVDGEYCLDPKKGEEEIELNGAKKKIKDLTPEEKIGLLCDVCNLFGHPFLASRIRFLDLPIITETWDELMLQVRDGVAIDRESGTAKEKAKFDYETIPAGTRFKLEISAENIEDWELGLLLFALDSLSNGYAFLGGNTSRGLGSVKIMINEYLDLSGTDLLEGKIESKKDVIDFKAKCLEALKKEIEGDKNDKART